MKQRKILAGVCAAAAVSLIAWLVLSGLGREEQRQRLPDGSMLTLQKVTFGKRHMERVGNRWKDFLVPILPEGVARKLGCNFAAAGGSNSLVFWLRHDGVAGGTAPRLHAATFDEHGCEYRVMGTSDARYRSTKRALLQAQFEEFPRRAATVGLRLYQPGTNGGYAQVAEFKVPNPGVRVYPTWPPEPLPATKSVSNLNFTLVELKGGLYGRSHPPQLPVPGEDSGAYLRFRIQENGKPAAAWGLSGISGIFDALGHKVGGGYASGGIRDGEFAAVVAGGLCVEESAWKVRVEFARTLDFPSNEVWQIKGIPVPDVQGSTLIDAARSIHGAQLHVRSIYGRRCPGPEPRRSVSSDPVVYLTVTNLSEGLDLKFVAAVDDRGRLARSGSSASSSSNYAFGLKLAADARTVDLTFAVTRRISVEFCVKPQRMTAEDIRNFRKEAGYQ